MTNDTKVITIGSPAGLLSVVPEMLGFTPANSAVVAGLTGSRDRVHVVLRYDMPAGLEASATLMTHAITVLRSVPSGK